MKIPPAYSFKKVGTKWKSDINPEFVFFMFQTLGFPPEMLIEEINNLSLQRRLQRKFFDWTNFQKQHELL